MRRPPTPSHGAQAFGFRTITSCFIVVRPTCDMQGLGLAWAWLGLGLGLGLGLAWAWLGRGLGPGGGVCLICDIGLLRCMWTCRHADMSLTLRASDGPHHRKTRPRVLLRRAGMRMIRRVTPLTVILPRSGTVTIGSGQQRNGLVRLAPRWGGAWTEGTAARRGGCRIIAECDSASASSILRGQPPPHQANVPPTGSILPGRARSFGESLHGRSECFLRNVRKRCHAEPVRAPGGGGEWSNVRDRR